MIKNKLRQLKAWQFTSLHHIAIAHKFDAFPKSPFPDGLISISPWDFGSFEPLTYIYFNIAFVIIAYPLYRIIGGFFRWELDVKTPSNHFSDMMALVRYGFIVFVLGGYARTFNWIMILSFYLALFGFALLSELPFAKQSLITWRNWTIKMWILFVAAVVAVLVMAGFHIYLAIQLMNVNNFREKNDVYIAWYLGSLVILPILMMFALIAKQEQNTRFLTKFYLKVISIFKRMPKKQQPLTNENGSETQQQTDTEAQNATTGTTPDAEPEQPQPYNKVARIHLHHWQIFYSLAFFTRFNHPISQVVGGITLGIYTQGIGAYGPDNYLEET
ncbi:unnamed protein product [Rhizophagus irregularis]|uniref:Uncharacterized protein n=3 Tax=Rhizophagus irregularis TaxID=588596 RepID=A0A915ZQ47_9GLOM|nr:unnamed protein product [Rhizophagus irregularis]CAB5385359.1 unnamed protein product [Rhizophagus irregularis]